MTSSTTHPLIRIVDGAAVPAVGIWNIDPAHTSAEFVARHLMVTKVRGRFEVAAGSIEIAESLSDSHVDVVLDTASVSTGAVDRDNHVKSADFLDVEN